MCRRYTSEKTHLMSIVDMRGTMKLLVSFAECCLFYRALLQKRPICIDISQVRKHISCQFVYVSCHSTTQKTHELNNSQDTRTQQLTRHITTCDASTCVLRIVEFVDRDEMSPVCP